MTKIKMITVTKNFFMMSYTSSKVLLLKKRLIFAQIAKKIFIDFII